MDFVIALGYALGFAVFIGLVYALSESVPKSEAIERGYALHCPDDGRFAWKGECDEP